MCPQVKQICFAQPYAGIQNVRNLFSLPVMKKLWMTASAKLPRKYSNIIINKKYIINNTQIFSSQRIENSNTAL